MAVMRANLDSINVGDMFLTKYEIRGLIGRGGQAAVFHSYDTYMDRDVAIKIMADTSDAKREHSRRAQMEARVLCKTHHPNIVHVYDAGVTESGMIYIIMELLRGRTLREVIRHVHKLTVREALFLGAQIADGVEVAHGQQVIHRDLKPENVFVVAGNTIKVLDFGIAKFLTLTGITTQRDTLQGTMWYISPEHVQGFGVTARSDVYALGSILYEAISGTPPCLVGLKDITTQSVAWSQISLMPPQLHELVPTVPPYVARIIYRMLMKEPAKRYDSMAEVAVALRNACARIETDAKGAAPTLRELWHDAVESTSQEASFSNDVDDADTVEERHSPNAMQPTVEVRQHGSIPETHGATHPAIAAVSQDSRVITPGPGKDTESVSLTPVNSSAGIPATKHQAVPSSAQEIAESKGAPEVANVAPSAGRRFIDQRWRMVVAAVATGIGVGVVVGISRGSFATHAEQNSVVSAEPTVNVSAATAAELATVHTTSSRANAPVLAASTNAATQVQDASASASTGRETRPTIDPAQGNQVMPTISKETVAPGVKPSQSRTATRTTDKGQTKKTPPSEPKPLFRVEDME